MKKLLQKPIIFLIILLLAIAFVVFKVKSKPPVKHEELQFPVRTVEVITAKKIPFSTRAIAYGNIQPTVLVKAKTEVSGKIVYIHPDLKKGGSIAKDTVVLRIEPTTFEFSLNQSKAGLEGSKSSLAQLEVEEKSTLSSLRLAQKNLKVGQKELDRLTTIWEKKLVGRSVVDAEEQKVLQLRQQVEDLQGKLSAYASRKAAISAQITQSQSQLAQSEDTLERTEIRMPFNARIGDVLVEKGEFTSLGSTLFEALGTKSVEINAQLPTQQFRPLLLGISDHKINMQNPNELQKSLTKMHLTAVVSLVGYDTSIATWQGELLRISESVDPTRDTIGLLISVKDPYAGIIPGKRPPLLKGMFASVELHAPLRDMMVIPRKAIHQGRVYVANSNKKLEIRPVNVIHKQGELVIIDKGVNEGEQIIISDVVPVINGLPIAAVENTEYEQKMAVEAHGSTINLTNGEKK